MNRTGTRKAPSEPERNGPSLRALDRIAKGFGVQAGQAGFSEQVGRGGITRVYAGHEAALRRYRVIVTAKPSGKGVAATGRKTPSNATDRKIPRELGRKLPSGADRNRKTSGWVSAQCEDRV
ncbi:hypothetical protein D9R08_02805 [Rhodophyticola porphyridii]|uniref:Uncharacterized protein n=1 Tax=Rhodophyticola porphyridii TaxID=1852017 RepID=A0A3L9Y646_9RHOB|nr:hypothetical protein D9R08_02805 [Rhodophyticola porphyridii]